MGIKPQEHKVFDPVPALHGRHDTAHEYGHRGHPAGTVVDGKTVRPPAAADVQPRHGAPKRLYDATMAHGGMTDQQRAGAGLGGMGHAVAVVSGGQKIVASIGAVPNKDGSANLLPLPHAYGIGAEKP